MPDIFSVVNDINIVSLMMLFIIIYIFNKYYNILNKCT